MGRWARGWQLTKTSWSVVKADRSLVAFPIISGIAALFCALVFFGAGAGLMSNKSLNIVGIVVIVIGLYLLVVISVFCGVALTACASRSLEGHDTTVGEGIAAAREKLDVIFAWAGVQLVIGALISIVQSLLREAGGGIVAAIFGGLANLAWTVATFFVIPVIALEGLGPRDAIKRSSAVLREHWGEGVTGSFAIGGIVFLLGFLPAGVLIFLGIVVANSSAAGAGVLIVLGVIVLVIAGLLQTTIMAVFRVALFRYATDSRVLGGFEQSELESAFAPKRR
jgi:Family of unknown function (DUF6159)